MNNYTSAMIIPKRIRPVKQKQEREGCLYFGIVKKPVSCSGKCADLFRAEYPEFVGHGSDTEIFCKGEFQERKEADIYSHVKSSVCGAFHAEAIIIHDRGHHADCGFFGEETTFPETPGEGNADFRQLGRR